MLGKQGSKFVLRPVIERFAKVDAPYGIPRASDSGSKSIVIVIARTRLKSAANVN